MLSSNKTLAKASSIVLAVVLIGVSQSSFAGGWRRNCQVYNIAGIRVRTCERNYRHWPRHHRRHWRHRDHRVCRTWQDRWGFHRRCF